MADFPASKKRWASGILLGIALLMLILGQTVLTSSLHNRAFIAYWLACFMVTGLAAIVALLDFFSLQRRARAQEKKIMEKAFREMVETKDK
jgi:hypothetical protein